MAPKQFQSQQVVLQTSCFRGELLNFRGIQQKKENGTEANHRQTER